MNRKWNLATKNSQSRIASHKRLATLAASLALGIAIQGTSFGQIIGGGFVNRVVGGVAIDSEGVARDVLEKDMATWAKEARQVVKGAQGELQQANERHVSLKQLVSALVEADKNHTAISEEVAYLGGLTRIEYILLYPESNDIVLVGPARIGKYPKTAQLSV